MVSSCGFSCNSPNFSSATCSNFLYHTCPRARGAPRKSVSTTISILRVSRTPRSFSGERQRSRARGSQRQSAVARRHHHHLRAMRTSTTGSRYSGRRSSAAGSSSTCTPHHWAFRYGAADQDQPPCAHSQSRVNCIAKEDRPTIHQFTRTQSFSVQTLQHPARRPAAGNKPGGLS